MSFTTLPFLVLVALSVAAYYLLPQRVQWMALLAASMVFYCVGGGKTVLYVFYTAVIVYGSGLLLGRFNDLRRAASQDRQNALLTASMTAQTNQIIGTLRAPTPVPAYQVPNPNAYYNGCGCNSGCGC